MSKEKNIINLFFEYPTKHWHFEDILKEAKISRPQANLWLKKFIKGELIKKLKPKNKNPYYVSDYESPNYRNKKRLFALEKLNNSGFFRHLLKLEKAKTIILFGSLSRWDWYKDSDVDLFIYGNPEGLKIVDYELKLHREIQLFICQNKNELKKLGQGLIKNIINGYTIKGNIDFIGVDINA